MKPYNERLPLIDKAIDDLGGEWPAKVNPRARLLVDTGCDDNRWMLVEMPYIMYGAVVCTYQEFEQRVKERNMKYEYMKEYECNGKRPEGLPGDTCVQIRYDGKWFDSFKDVSAKDWIWEGADKFRIVDGRYKPDNTWYERGELPPVDRVVTYEYVKGGTCKGECTVLGFDGDWVWFKPHCAQHQTMKLSKVKFHPLPTEEDRLVEQAMEAILKRLGDYSNLLTSKDAAEFIVKEGWRPPEEK